MRGHQMLRGTFLSSGEGKCLSVALEHFCFHTSFVAATIAGTMHFSRNYCKQEKKIT